VVQKGTFSPFNADSWTSAPVAGTAAGCPDPDTRDAWRTGFASGGVLWADISRGIRPSPHQWIFNSPSSTIKVSSVSPCACQMNSPSRDAGKPVDTYVFPLSATSKLKSHRQWRRSDAIRARSSDRLATAAGGAPTRTIRRSVN